MSQAIPRLLEVSDREVLRASRVKRIVRDGVVDQDEVRELYEIAEDILGDGVEVLDIASDFRLIDQIWRLGRHAAPNSHLAAELNNLEKLREAREENALQRSVRHRARAGTVRRFATEPRP